MTQMDQQLQPGEVITSRTRPSLFALLAHPVMLAVLAVAGVMFLTALFSLPGATGNGRTSALLLMLFVIAGLAVFLARQARFLVYLATRLGSRAVRARDLTSGKTATLVTSPTMLFNPRISGDAATVAYSDSRGNLFAVPRTGGEV